MVVKDLKYLVGICLVLFFSSVYSQESNSDEPQREDRNSWNFGVQGGFSLNNLYYNTFGNEKKKEAVGNLIGVNVRKNIVGNFDIISSLSFMYYQVDFNTTATTCCSQDNSVFLSGGELTTESRNFQLSILGSYRIIKDNVSIQAGPTINYSSGFDFPRSSIGPSFLDGTFNSSGSNDFIQLDLENLSPLNLLFQVGATVGFDKLKITVQYQNGLTDVFRNVDVSERPEIAIEGSTSAVLLMTVWYF